MRSKMLMGMDRMPEPSTTMLIREVENGYVVDVELKGDDGMRPVRFGKYVAPTHVDLEVRVRALLLAFEARKTESSNRIMGNLQSQEVERKMMAIHQLKGGFLVVTANPTRKKLDEAMLKARHFRMAAVEGQELPEEYPFTEWEESIVPDKEAVVALLAQFFGKPAE